MSKSDSGTDKDVLTKNDRENKFPINFQPIAKRFRVWDKIDKDFILINYKSKTGSIEDIVNTFKYNPYVLSQCIIVQSTNLFDREDKEIFEGSIVKVGERIGSVEFVDNEWKLHAVNDLNDLWYKLGQINDLVRVIGHVLSDSKMIQKEKRNAVRVTPESGDPVTYVYLHATRDGKYVRLTKPARFVRVARRSKSDGTPQVVIRCDGNSACTYTTMEHIIWEREDV